MKRRDYLKFLFEKSQIGGECGFSPLWMPEFLFDFQRHLVEWSLRKGRAAIFADCGLGKTPMLLVWAENVARQTRKPVLVLAPLAVSAQTAREAAKFGIECRVSRDGTVDGAKVHVTNYERLHYFNQVDFGGVVCDESSILKNFDGVRQAQITEFMREIPYRMLCTATAAPNDYIELGTSSEALGELGHMDMLSQFFKNDTDTLHINGCKAGDFFAAKWRFKKHAELHFWRWVCSWARALRKPSDLGFDDARFALPALAVEEMIVAARSKAKGVLFDVPAKTMQEQREENKRTINERCEMAAEKIAEADGPSVAWCNLNPEGQALARLIPGSVEISGDNSDDEKEEAFIGFTEGKIKVLITKPKIGGFGLNWQHCAHMTYFPSHSYEQFYQAVRRCWRFGQSRDVLVNVITTTGGQGVVENLNRKSAAADRMFSALVAEMNNALSINRVTEFKGKAELPSWLCQTNGSLMTTQSTMAIAAK